MSDQERMCATCVHYNANDSTCRRYPPVAVHVPTEGLRMSSDRSVWPGVYAEDVCGEWREKDE